MWLGRESSDLWFETFEMISKNGLVALDSDLKDKITIDGDCLGAIYKTSVENNIPSFILTAWDCGAKKTAVCEKQPTKFHATNAEQPNFPCIPQKLNRRKKRNNGAAFSPDGSNIGKNNVDLSNSGLSVPLGSNTPWDTKVTGTPQEGNILTLPEYVA